MNNIIVGNLSIAVTEQAVRSVFEKHGPVRRLKMMTDFETGRPRGFAFVEMKNDSEAAKAIAATNGTEVSGKVISVNAARPQLHRNALQRMQ
jgi:RNA recognition motif-containing protein